MSASHRVIVNTGILYARMGITLILSLYTTRLVLLALGVGDFGIFNIVGGSIAMLTFLNSSMAAATQRFMSFAQGEGNVEKQKMIFNVSVILHALIAVIVLFVLEIFGWILFHGILKINPNRISAAWLVYQFAAASTLFTILSVPYDAIINARENMFLFAIIGIVEAVAKVGIAILITHATQDKLVVYGLSMALLSILLMLLRTLYCHGRYAECVLSPKKSFNRGLFKEMTSFAGWSLLGTSSGMIANYGQGIVVNTFFGTTVNAAHALSAQVSGQLGALAVTMQKALNPIMAKSEGAGDRIMLVKATLAGSKIGFALLMLLYVPVFLEMPYIFTLWLKNPPDYAVVFCRLLLIRNLIEQLYITSASAVFAVGKIKNLQMITATLNLLPLVLTFFMYKMGLPPYSLYLAFIGYSLVMLFIILKSASYYCGINMMDYTKQVLVPSVSSYLLCSAVALVPFLRMDGGLVRLCAVVGVSFVAYLACVWKIVLRKAERDRFRSAAQKGWNKINWAGA